MGKRKHGSPSERDHPREYGENRGGSGIPQCRRDHPREYGENRKDEERTEAAQGIIPANTGRIWVALMISVSAGDHPREYGENSAAFNTESAEEGSSPRIRGECAVARILADWCGIIPANTGRMLR